MPGSWIVYSNNAIQVDGRVLEIQANGRNENLRHTVKVVVWGPDDEHLFDVVTRAQTHVDTATGRSRSAADQQALRRALRAAETEARSRAEEGDWEQDREYEVPAQEPAPAHR